MRSFKPEKRPNTFKVSSVFPFNDKTASKPRPTFVKNLKAYLWCYCEASTVHGVKYIGEKGRYLIEKLVWLCIVVTVCLVCVLLINRTYIKWKMSPVIMSFETKETPIFEIPFPAVTVCPEVKIDADYFNFTEYVIKKMNQISVTDEETKLFDSFLMLCDMVQHHSKKDGIEFKTNFVGENFYVDLKAAAGKLHIEDETIMHFLGQDVKHLISMSMTEEGICYTFNMLPGDEILRNPKNLVRSSTKANVQIQKWSLEDGYPPGDNLDSYPKRTFLSGFDGGLVIDGLYANHSQLDYLCQEGVQGFKIALHHPSELANMDNHFRLSLNRAGLVAIKPTMITVSKELLNYEPNDRRCYFPNEKYLSLYKLYTQRNCLTECLSNLTLKNCGCVSFWMPRVEGTKICGPGKRDCVIDSKIAYLNPSNTNQKGVEQCKCFPACTLLSYDIETSYTNWDWRELYNLYVYLNISTSKFNPDTSHFSKLIVYYKDLQFMTTRRHELYGIEDFFSNVGGLLGLFIGFTVISAIEIMYFLTLRIICNVKKYGRECWSGEPDLMYN